MYPESDAYVLIAENFEGEIFLLVPCVRMNGHSEEGYMQGGIICFTLMKYFISRNCEIHKVFTPQEFCCTWQFVYNACTMLCSTCR